MTLNAMQLYLRYVSVSMRSQWQYRASTLMYAAGHFLLTGMEFIAMWSLFDRFGSIRGWTLPQVALLYGMANAAFAISEAAARGFDTFDGMVKSGDFDRLLLRPRSTAFQVGAAQFQLMRIGRFSQGLIIMLWAAAALDVHWTAARVALLIAAILAGACLFSGIFIIQATIAFWTIESLEVVNTLTYGGVEATQYPIDIYDRWLRRLLLYVIPLGTMNYFPALAILDKPDPLGFPAWVSWVSPLVGIVFLLVSLRIWRFGERKYRSTGS